MRVKSPTTSAPHPPPLSFLILWLGYRAGHSATDMVTRIRLGWVVLFLLAAPGVAAASAAANLTPSRLAADLEAGARLTRVPANLEPPLDSDGGPEPVIVSNGCHLAHPGVKSKPCVYGDSTSRTVLVLFGDSHAAQWFPALDEIANQRRWRLVDLTKAGCPPAEVNIAAWFLDRRPYTACAQWRRNAMSQIAALRPALVIATSWRGLEAYEARPMAGVPTGYGSPWLDGTAAIFNFLRHHAAHVLFISDIPTQQRREPTCILAHVSDVQACDTPRTAAVALPGVKAQEIAIAEQEGIDWIDPTSWFCTQRTCPVIVNDILVYRNASHMSVRWAQFLTPLLSRAIVPIVR